MNSVSSRQVLQYCCAIKVSIMSTVRTKNVIDNQESQNFDDRVDLCQVFKDTH